jgi:hypothetical protein
LGAIPSSCGFLALQFEANGFCVTFGGCWCAHYLFRNISLWQLLFLLLFVAAVGEGILSNLGLLLYFSERFGEEEAQKFILGQEVLATPVVGFLVAMLRFVLGPGPFRSLQQILYGNVFEVSTHLGDLLIFLGSFAWWGLLLAVLVRLFSSSRERSLFSLVVSLTREWFFLGLGLGCCLQFHLCRNRRHTASGSPVPLLGAYVDALL